MRGPRMTSAGRYLTTSNGIADFYPTSVGVPEGSVGVLTNTADEMVAAVRKHVKNGSTSSSWRTARTASSRRSPTTSSPA